MLLTSKSVDFGRSGFALLITLVLMVLLTILAVGLLSLNTIALRSSGQNDAMSVARANARLALSLAIAGLQKHAGPDQRITARADLLDKASANPMWTAVWNSEGGNPAFLVSGNSANDLDLGSLPTTYPSGYHLPENSLPTESSSLLFGRDLPASRQVRAPEVTVQGSNQGSYAYWISDDGVKARVDLKNPYRNAVTEERKRLAVSSSQSNSISYASDILKTAWPADESNFEKVISLDQADLLPGVDDFKKQYFHDFSTDSEGLLTDAKNGGLKRDLTLAFENEAVFERWFGREQLVESIGSNNASNEEAKVTTEGGYSYSTGTPGAGAEKFFISDEFRTYRNKEAGPNWGILAHYYNLYKKVETEAENFPVLFPHPPSNMQSRRNAWDPYSQYVGSSASGLPAVYLSDIQHTNNYVAPVPARLQMTYRLKSRLTGIRPDGKRVYAIDLEFKPVVGVWNPYNVAFGSHRYRIEWEMSPILKVEIDDPLTFPSAPLTMEIDMTGWYGRTDDSDLLTFYTQDLDLRPGELRIFSLTDGSVMSARKFRQTGTGTAVNTPGRFRLNATWGADGYFRMPLPEQLAPPSKNATFKELLVTENANIKILSLSLSEQSYDLGGASTDTAGNWFSFKPGPRGSGRSSIIGTSRSTNIWQPSVPAMAPEAITDIAPITAQDLSSSLDLGTWVFSLRSTEGEPGQNIRNLIDSNVRALNINSRWDGSQNGDGLATISLFKGEGAEGRGLLDPLSVPEPISSVDGRYSMSHGDGTQPYVVAFDLPHSRPLSLGQFQHAVLGRYNNEPSFVLGNSYASIRVPLNKKINTGFLGSDSNNTDTGLRTFDISYLVNEEVWDGYFLSGIAADDSLLTPGDFEKIARAETPAPNSRIKILDPTLKKDELISPADVQLSEEIAAHLAIRGAFNVNSTSVTAWRAVLAGMADLKVPVVDPATKTKNWEQAEGVIFSRFSSSPGEQGDVWKGFQHLTDVQLDALATEIVNQVQARGPFRSLGDFVNRSLKVSGGTPASEAYDGPDIRLSGALQTALDHEDVAINSDIAEFPGKASDPSGGHFEKILSGQSKAAGYAGHILQGDILQAIAPVIAVRSDTFMVRASGAARDSDGNVTARAWCEAVIQRTPQALDTTVELTGNDKVFGRKFAVVKFRWLSRNDI